MRSPAPLVGLLLGLVLVRSAPAEDAVALPAGLESVAESPEEARRWDAVVADLAVRARTGPPGEVRRARARLRAGGAVALKHAARRLLAAGAEDPVAEHLALVLGASPHPDVDAVLARLARSPSAALRALAADGLARERAEGTGAAQALTLLAGDPFPGVRAAAQRALFAREDAAAVAVRLALPPDPDPDLEARRLTLHRLRGEASDAVVAHARTAWTAGATPTLRLAGARLLAQSNAGTPTDALLALVQALGEGPVVATAARWLAGAPLAGADPVEERRVAVDAALTALRRDLVAEDRVALIDRCVEWIAHPVPMDARSLDSLPEAALRRRLPDLGAEALPALERRFAPGGFAAPRDGTMLLAEMPPADVLPVLERLLEPGRAQAVRVAASGALRLLAMVGSETLAKRLTAPEEDPAVRRDVIGALAAAEEPWAVSLLGRLLDAPTAETVEAAGDALEERREPEARALLEAFVLDGRCPEHRLQARLGRLTAPWSADARSTWTRALAGARRELRAAALALAARFPLPALQDLLPALRDHAPRLQGAAEVEAWFPALLRVAPEEALAWLRAHWDDLPVQKPLSTRCRALGALDLVRARALEPAVVDLLLEKAGGSDDPGLLENAVDALGGRKGVRDADVDALFARLLEGRGVRGGEERAAEVAAATVTALEKPGRGDLTPLLLPLLARYVADADQTHRAVALVRALEHQPWSRVEAPVLALALDGTAPVPVRSAAGWLLAGRASADARARLLDWLLVGGVDAPDPQVLLALAAAAGTGGGPETGTALAAALRGALLAFAERPESVDPFAERLDALPVRVQALAAGVAHTGHAPSLDALTGLLLDARFAPWAEAVLRHARLKPGGSDPLAALRPLAETRVVRLEEGLPGTSVLTPEIAMLALGLKALGDEALAASLARAIAEPGAAEALAAFPDAWAFKLAVLLRDPRTRDHARAGALLEERTEALEPVDGPFDLAVRETRALEALRDGRFAAAADLLREARALRARRGGDFEPGREDGWRLSRALELACRAAARAEDDEPGARLALAAVGGDLADAPAGLAALARIVARTGLDPERAEAIADRAIALERRSDHEEALGSVAALAEVLLARGRPGAAARRLGDALGRSLRPEHGRLHFLLAQALAAHGDVEGAAQALRRALLLEPSLDREARASPAFEALREDGTLERVLRESEDAQRAGAED